MGHRGGLGVRGVGAGVFTGFVGGTGGQGVTGGRGTGIVGGGINGVGGGLIGAGVGVGTGFLAVAAMLTAATARATIRPIISLRVCCGRI